MGKKKEAANPIYSFEGQSNTCVEVFIPERFGEDLGGQRIEQISTGRTIFDSNAAKREGYDFCLEITGKCHDIGITLRPTKKLKPFHLAIPYFHDR